MDKTYGINVWSKIFYPAIGLGLVIFSVYLIYLPVHNNVSKWMILLPIVIAIVGVLLALNQFIAKIVLTDSLIKRTNIFKTSEMLLTDIKGVRIGEKVITLEAISGISFSIRNYDEFSGSEGLVDWLKKNFTDLDAVDLKLAELELLNNQELGVSEDERKAELEKAKKIALIYNVMGGVLGGLSFFFPTDKTMIIFEITFPLLGILLMMFSKGLIKFVTSSKRSTLPMIMIGFLIPSFLLLLYSSYYFDLYDYTNLWLQSFSTAVVIAFLLYKTGINIQLKPLYGQAIAMLIFANVYAFGVTRVINCAFDNSTATVFHTTVKNKYRTYGKGTHFHVMLQPWERGGDTKEVDVGEREYNKIQDTDPVTVYQKRGLLNIPWFECTVDTTPPAPADSNNGNSPGPR